MLRYNCVILTTLLLLRSVTSESVKPTSSGAFADPSVNVNQYGGVETQEQAQAMQ